MNTDKLNAYCTSYNSTMYTFLSAYIYLFNCAHTHAEWCFAAFGGWQNIQDAQRLGVFVRRTATLVRTHATERTTTTVRIHPTHQPGLGADVASLTPSRRRHTFVRSSGVVAVPRPQNRTTQHTSSASTSDKINPPCRPQIMCDYPLNLSILIRGGKETNKDSPSSCERKGKSSARRGGALPASTRFRVLEILSSAMPGAVSKFN